MGAKQLWANSSPSSGYSAIDITTIPDDYDVVLVLIYGNTTLVSYGPGSVMPICRGMQGFFSNGTDYCLITFETNGRLWISGRTSTTGAYPGYVIGI